MKRNRKPLSQRSVVAGVFLRQALDQYLSDRSLDLDPQSRSVRHDVVTQVLAFLDDMGDLYIDAEDLPAVIEKDAAPTTAFCDYAPPSALLNATHDILYDHLPNSQQSAEHLLLQAPLVLRSIIKWLIAHRFVGTRAARRALRVTELAERDFACAVTLRQLLARPTTSTVSWSSSSSDLLDGRFDIVEVDANRVSFMRREDVDQGEDDGEEFVITLPAEAAALCVPGWSIVMSIEQNEGEWEIADVEAVLPHRAYASGGEDFFEAKATGVDQSGGGAWQERFLRATLDIVESQEFSSPEEVSEFLQQKLGSHLADLKPSEDPKDRALWLAEDARAAEDPKEAKRLADKALELDPNCAEALVVIGDRWCSEPRDAIQMYKAAIKAAEHSLGPAYFQRHAGSFWSRIETRPLMRALERMALTYWVTGAHARAVKAWERVLELDAQDHQGVRGFLLRAYLRNRDKSRALALLERFAADESALMLWGRFIASIFFQENKERVAALRNAVAANPYVIAYLLRKAKFPDLPPEYYSPGHDSEARYCLWMHGEVIDKPVQQWVREYISHDADFRRLLRDALPNLALDPS